MLNNEINTMAEHNIVFPNEVPPDSDDTTANAHDPSIFKDAVSGNYYAYSTHNLVFESPDLVHWKKHDFRRLISVPESCKRFAKEFYGADIKYGYWAPDILYNASSEYPYWLYISVSCQFGTRNSFIALVKSKSPRIWDGEYIDCGIVIASRHDNSFNTNAIDANIFTDTDGSRYFIWGSFWKGIYGLPINANGTLCGIDAASFGDGRDKDIKNVFDDRVFKNGEKSLFATPKSLHGPEGPWLTYNPDTGYKYLLVSYGWLGTNYNIRVARSDKPMRELLSTQYSACFTDHRGRNVGEGYDCTDSELSGYKLIGSYRLGDGITYMGNGHCSVLNDDGKWYLVEHCRKKPDGQSFLQVHKMLWTKDGWPVVSPLVYSGEEVQNIPVEMLVGKWDIASVGKTLIDEGVESVYSRNAEKNVDLPVLSYEITLLEDGAVSMNGSVFGKWSFDGEYTAVITFTSDSSNENGYCFKRGDVLTMYILTGYDKDERTPALIMTGCDENHITQFAKKRDL